MIRWTGEAQPGEPWWWAARKKHDWSDSLPEKTDILVVGAGYTGLAAAISAHECGAKVVVVDASIPGDGASTRNGGMFGAHPRLSWEKLSEEFGEDTADRIFAEATGAQKWVEDLIERENIACDLERTGRIQLAWTGSQFEAQKALVHAVKKKTDVAISVVERDALGTEIGTEVYFGGILFPDHGGLHPAKFHDGLVEAARKRAIPILARTPVTHFEKTGAVFSVMTSAGKITADRLVIATNGYSTSALGWFRQRVFPLPSYLIATEELPENLVGRLAPGGRMMVETRARHSYFRVSPDGKRVIFGGRASMTGIPPEKAAARLRKTMLEIWPELEETKLSHTWSGDTGYSFSHVPHVGQKDGLHYAVGFSGSGTVLAPYLGAKAGYQACGDPRGETPYSDTGLKRSWLHPTGTPHFLKAADLWYRFKVDRDDNRAARRDGAPL